ncbi:hypothetical protein EV292_106329 [Sphingomonas sp. BK235]|nr:hypothetical protein EV292_106329 [Sphingomonas sp. BK235]
MQAAFWVRTRGSRNKSGMTVEGAQLDLAGRIDGVLVALAPRKTERPALPRGNTGRPNIVRSPRRPQSAVSCAALSGKALVALAPQSA